MQRQIVTDVCDVDETHTGEIVTRTITVDGHGATIDVCPADLERILGPLEALINSAEKARQVRVQTASRARARKARAARAPRP